MIGGKGQYKPQEQIHAKRFKMDCDGGASSSGGGGTTGDGGPESGGDSGSTGNDGGSESDTSTGGTGGESDSNTGSTGGFGYVWGSNGCSWETTSSSIEFHCPIDPPEPDSGDDLITKSITCDSPIEAPVIGDGDAIGNLPPASLFDDYSGDGDNDPDYEAESYQGPLKEIPTKFELDNGKSVDVTFGVTQSDMKSAQNPVKPSLVDAIEFALNEVSKLHDINHIHVSSTTNGEHHPQSNHYRNKAVDISRINNEKIYNIRNSEIVKDFQEAFERFYDIRENFGPHLKNKLGEPYEVGGHQDHIHISVN